MGAKPTMIKFIAAFLFVLNVFADESKEAAKEGAPAESAAPTPDQKSSKELMDVEKQVTSLGAKVKAKSDSVELLLKQKSVEKDPEKLMEIVKLVQQEHRELEQVTREYNTQLGVLQYRFPERGFTQGRRYQRLNTKSLEDMEKTLGLDAHLKNSRERVKTVYGIKDNHASKKDGTVKKDPKAEESLLQPATLSK